MMQVDQVARLHQVRTGSGSDRGVPLTIGDFQLPICDDSFATGQLTIGNRQSAIQRPGRYRFRFRFSAFWLLIILLCGASPLVATSSVAAKSFHVKKVPLRFTRRLPRIDKVELQKLKTKEIWFESIEATKLIEGSEAQAIAALWRTQNYNSFNAICHYPVYGIRFYSRGKVILYASVCWECDNILVMEPTLGARQGFDGGSRKGQELLKVFTGAFPR